MITTFSTKYLAVLLLCALTIAQPYSLIASAESNATTKQAGSEETQFLESLLTQDESDDEKPLLSDDDNNVPESLKENTGSNEVNDFTSAADDLESPTTGSLQQDETTVRNESEVELEPLYLKLTLHKEGTLLVDPNLIISLILEQNLNIARQRVIAKGQNALFYRSLTDFFPDIQGSLDGRFFKGGIQIFGNQILPVSIRQRTPQLTATMQLNPGGRDLWESIAQRRRYKSAKALLSTSSQQELTEGLSEYYALLEAWQQLTYARTSLNEAESQVKLSQGRLDAGVSTKLELMQSESTRAQREQGVITAENDFLQSEQRLLSRLNLDTDVHLTPASKTQTMVRLVPENLTLDTLMAETLKKHPEVRQIELEMKARYMDMVARISDVVPSITLSAFRNKTGPNFRSLVKGQQRALRVETNLLENAGFALPLDVRKAYLDYKEKKIERSAKVRALQTEITSAYLNSQAQAKSVKVAHVQLAAAEEGYRLAKGRYEVGLGISLDVQNALTTLANARSNLARTTMAFNRAEIRLLDALGEATPNNLRGGFALTSSNDDEKTSSPET